MEIIDKYKILQKIGKGKFGEIYKGINKYTNEIIAIKTENYNSLYKTLKHESFILQYLTKNNCYNIPCIYWYGIIDNKINMIIPYYKDTIINNLYFVKNINYFMKKMINILKDIHNLYIIHRDIKPTNFMINNNNIYLIDFGLSNFYLDDKGNHIKNKINNDNIVGSYKFISINLHNFNTPTRRDDMISLGYLYLYIINNYTYWAINENNTNINIFIKKTKEWEYFKNYLNENTNIYNYLYYSYNLSFEQMPDYDKLISYF